MATDTRKVGVARITADLRDEGWRVSVNTVATIMAELGLKARVKRRRSRPPGRPGPLAGAGPGPP